MKQLREFAQRKADFDAQNAEIVAISIDDEAHNRKVWEEVAQEGGGIERSGRQCDSAVWAVASQRP